MTILATAQWEVRPTTGDNLNGSGYDAAISGAGTDYSQQAAAQLTLTDLVTSGAGVAILTSVTGGFTAAMVGNAIRIASGTNFTVGWYFLVTYTNTNTVTLDRTPTPAGAGVGGAGKVGGATASLRNQATVGLCNNAGGIVAGNTVWVKNEAWNELAIVSQAGTATLPITLEGYNTVRGDAPTESNRPHNNRGVAVGPAFSLTGDYLRIKYLWASHVSNSGSHFNVTSSHSAFLGCRASNGTGLCRGFDLQGAQTVLLDCEADTHVNSGILLFGTYLNVRGLWCHDNTAYGLQSGSPNGIVNIRNALITGNSAGGMNITASAAYILDHLTIAGNLGATSDGILVDTAVRFFIGSSLFNSIIASNGRDGLRLTDAATAAGLYADYNNFYLNTGAARTNIAAGSHDVAVDPQFVNAASGNYAIGQNLKALGWPGLFPGGLTTGYTDIGAAQRQEAGGTFGHGNMSGGLS